MTHGRRRSVVSAVAGLADELVEEDEGGLFGKIAGNLQMDVSTGFSEDVEDTAVEMGTNSAVAASSKRREKASFEGDSKGGFLVERRNQPIGVTLAGLDGDGSLADSRDHIRHWHRLEFQARPLRKSEAF